jgi:putative alpha-1,2-mannosidase
VNDLFTADPGGIPGNDDLGATSSWLVFAELGMFPAIPGVGGVTLSTPAFPDVMAHLGNHVLHIQAPGSQTLPYISDIVLDGKKIGNWWIPWESLSTGNKLVFSLQDRPNQLSGSAPPSYVP